MIMILTEFFAREADLYEKEFIWTGTGNIFCDNRCSVYLSDYIVLLKLSYNQPLYIESLFFCLLIHHLLQVAVLFSLLCNQ